MWLPLKTLLLIWAVNFAPPMLAYLLDRKGSRPLDGGRHFIDGKPLLGPHKTWRGLAGGTAAGLLAGAILGFPWWVGLLSGFLSMAGDALSSFIKRRMDWSSGSAVFGLDQLFEGLFPFLILGPFCSFSLPLVLALLAFFVVTAHAGSWFLKRTLFSKPFENYPRPLCPRTRLREWRACQMAYSPLHPLFNLQRTLYYRLIMKNVFRLLGVYHRGVYNALEVQRSDVVLHFPDLPSSFEGYTILFLSDLHLDGLEGLTERLKELVHPLEVDLCVFGGDFRMEIAGPFSKVLRRLNHLLRDLHARDGIYSVLGNHDCLEMVEPLTRRGVRFLLNDARAMVRDGQRLWLVGVDDPHYYRSHNLEEAFKTVPPGEFAVFVAHTPELYRDAARFGARLYLCGHTHAGQVCLPLVGAVFTHTKASRRLLHGVWEHQGMSGYTTAGAGVSGLDVRFGCRGEVVCLTLKKGSPPEFSDPIS